MKVFLVEIGQRTVGVFADRPEADDYVDQLMELHGVSKARIAMYEFELQYGQVMFPAAEDGKRKLF